MQFPIKTKKPLENQYEAVSPNTSNPEKKDNVSLMCAFNNILILIINMYINWF